MARIAPHFEQHFTGSEMVRDVVIGMSDGLTVPFALAAGLSGAVQNHWLIVVAGSAEMAAGSIAMGLGGYLAAKSDADSYRAEQAREQREIVELPDVEREEVRTIFAGYGLKDRPLEAAGVAGKGGRSAFGKRVSVRKNALTFTSNLLFAPRRAAHAGPYRATRRGQRVCGGTPRRRGGRRLLRRRRRRS